MTDALKRWIEENKLQVTESETETGLPVMTIQGIGIFLYIGGGSKDGKLIDGDFSFLLSDDELDVLDNKAVNYILFEFGGKFYYSPLRPDTNVYNEAIYKPEFNDFKYLGRSSETPPMEFVHLGVHDEYEMLSGSGACDLWCRKAKFLGHRAIGVCDYNSLASSLAFQTAAESQGLKPIIGETLEVAVGYDPNDGDIPVTYELKVFVLNGTGWANILAISKEINVDYGGFIPQERLLRYGEGLVCVIAKGSEFNEYLKTEHFKEARRLLREYRRAFTRVYYQIDTVEYVSRQLFREHLSVLDTYLSEFRSEVDPIVLNDAYYLDEEEHDLKSMLHRVSGRAAPEALNQYFKSATDTLRSYEAWTGGDDGGCAPLREALESGMRATTEVADLVTFRINNSERKIPHFVGTDDPESMFFTELQRGIEAKLIGRVDDMDRYMERLRVECELIVPNDLCSYFLILWDISNWCRERDILVGPGRGSVCGSLVAYCLDITQVDPLKYQLYFERFLNASRVSAHHSYRLVLSDGRSVTFRDGDRVPLVGGGQVEAGRETDWMSLDIDTERLK